MGIEVSSGTLPSQGSGKAALCAGTGDSSRPLLRRAHLLAPAAASSVTSASLLHRRRGSVETAASSSRCWWSGCPRPCPRSGPWEGSRVAHPQAAEMESHCLRLASSSCFRHPGS